VKINSLESLRGVAALSVVLYHLPAISFYHFSKGLFGVYFFFSLSGFVIALNYFDRIKNLKSFLNFEKKRFLRLYPLHILVLFLVLIIQISKLYLVDFLPIKYEQKAFQPQEWFTKLDFIQHIFLIQSVTNLGYPFSWNSAAWTISVEFYAYIIFALLIILIRNNQIAFSTIIIFFLFFFEIIFKFLKPFINFFFLDGLRYFLTGSLMFIIYRIIKFRFSDFFVILLLFFLIFFNKFLPNYIFYSLIILIISIQKENNYIYRLLNKNYFVYFGTISYSFYMIHFINFYLFNQILKLLNINFYSTADNYNIILDTVFTAIYLILTTLLSILIYKNVENRFRVKI
jgi:peptidoglycan/LPS O-acetylase OafA/YrhL